MWLLHKSRILYNYFTAFPYSLVWKICSVKRWFLTWEIPQIFYWPALVGNLAVNFQTDFMVGTEASCQFSEWFHRWYWALRLRFSFQLYINLAGVSAAVLLRDVWNLGSTDDFTIILQPFGWSHLIYKLVRPWEYDVYIIFSSGGVYHLMPSMIDCMICTSICACSRGCACICAQFIVLTGAWCWELWMLSKLCTPSGAASDGLLGPTCACAHVRAYLRAQLYL